MLAIQLDELLNPLEGKVLLIEEFITRGNSRGYDRHCSIPNKVRFAVEKVMWQMSGGNFYLYRPESTQYAFLSGELASISVDKYIHEIIEQYENKTERKTILTVEEKECIKTRKHGSHKAAPLRSATLCARLRETLKSALGNQQD